MAKKQQIECAKRDVLRGLAFDALVFTLFGAAWTGTPASTLSTTSVAPALALSVVGLLAGGQGWG